MSSIEIQKGIEISLEEILKGMAQMDVSSLEKFSEEINRLVARKKISKPSERELELIHQIYLPLDDGIQERYDLLVNKNLEGVITNEEHKELLSLVEIAEKHNIKWLEALTELSELRGLPLGKVKEQLGVRNPEFPGK